MDRLNFLNLNSILEVAEEKIRRWAVHEYFFPEHFSECTCRIVFKFYTQHLGGLVVPFEVYEL